MEIIVFSNRDNTQKDLLLKEISQIPNLDYRMNFDLDTLFETVKFKASDAVFVFLITFEEELDLLISNKRRFFNARFILILSDTEKTLVSKGLSLHPRYLAQTDYGFRDVAAVLDKMANNRHEERDDI
ncbi:MAG: hypothetical protein R6V41_04940 [Desulfobacteraceae bacterium]